MKCNNCGYENKEGANFCVKCGKSLHVKTNENVNIAELLTGNKEVARTIQENANNADDVFMASLSYVQSRNANLFVKEKDVDTDTPVLENVQDIHMDFMALDYEERIVVYRYCILDESLDEVSEKLHISKDMIRKLLQSAYLKKYPKGPAEPIVEIEVKTEEIKEPHLKFPIRVFDENRRISNQFIVICVSFIIVAVAVLIGLRMYGTRSYDQGLAYYESGQYEQAIEQLQEGKRFGDREQASLLLAEVYVLEGQYDNAIAEYLYLVEQGNADIKDELFMCYQIRANQELDQGNNEQAYTYLEQANSVIEDTLTTIQMNAINNGGQYTDTNTGTIYNVYGNPVTIYLRSLDNQLLLQADIIYDDTHQVDSIQITDETGTYSIHDIPSIFDFHALQDEQYFLQDYINHEIITDSDDTYTFTYIYNSDDQMQACIVSDDTNEWTYTYTYEDESVIESTKDEVDEAFLPFAGQRVITYRYSESGSPLTSTIYDDNGNVLANGTYVQEQGWIYLYYPYEEIEMED